jgi:alpha-tubulin suppressor-like RCC1 family protein
VQVSNTAGNPFVAIAAGGQHVLALQSDGSLWAWGSNQYGQIGQDPADTSAHSTPVQIGGDTDWKVIAAGGSHSLAIKADGTLWAWGLSSAGQLGIGITDSSPHMAPVQVGTDEDWAAISAGDIHSLAVKRNGSLWTWGGNSNGQLGYGTTTNQNMPKLVSILSDGTDITDIVAVAAGATHSLAMNANGGIYGWGGNLSGQLGDGTTSVSLDPFPVANDAISWVGTEPGGQFTAARRSNGTLWTWGDNSSGQLGYSTAPATTQTTPAQVGSGTNWTAQAAGWNHTVALKADGTIWAWGDNSSGQLGDNTAVSRPTPAQIGTTQPASATNDWTAVAAGDFHTLALKADGTLWAWGDNTSGQLGDGTTISRSVPVQIDDGIGGHWIAIAAGGSHSMALQSDGTLWTWGDNSSGQLGDPTVVGVGGSPAFSSAPRQIVNMSPPTTGYNSNWIAIAAGLDHSLALQADGTLWAWGGNFSGQLGTGDTTDQTAPTKLPGTSLYVAIAAGDSFSVARQADGSLWSWGNNASGQLGNGSTDALPHATPLRESTNANDWVIAGSGGSHTIALKADGTLSAWGSNSFGQLGNGTTVASNAPTTLLEARIEVAPETLAYNVVAFGAGSSMEITISNKGAADLSVSAFTFSGTDSAMFTLFNGGGTCAPTPFTLPVSGSCTKRVVFNSAAPAGIKEATLNITSSDPNRPIETVDLSGTAGVQHTITASAPPGKGTISPPGAVLVLDGTSQSFIVTPAFGYHVADIKVDGVSNGPLTSITLPSVKANGTVEASFALNVYNVTTTSVNGSITGAAKVTHGSAAIYNIMPNIGYHIADVKVDGVSQGAVTTLTLPVVTADKAITAIFAVNTTTIPLAGSVKINNGTPLTGKTAVTLNLSASDPSGVPNMQIACDGVNFSGPEPFAATRACILPSGDGAKTVAVMFIDGLGTVHPQVTASITLDSVMPVTTITPAPGNYTDSVALTLSASKTGSTIYYTTDGSTVTTSSSVYSSPIRLAAATTTPFTVKFMAVDQAGNVEAINNAAYMIHLGCDLNGDGKVDVSDALKALKITVGLDTPNTYDMIRGDVAPLVNGKPVPNGIIDITDTLVILQRSVGLVSPW